MFTLSECTACELLGRQDILNRLVYLCANSDHQGVRAEAPRLLAWLVKHSRSAQACTSVLRTHDAVLRLVEMLCSAHALMQNEALLALNLLAVYEPDMLSADTVKSVPDTAKSAPHTTECAQGEHGTAQDEQHNVECVRGEHAQNSLPALHKLLAEADLGKYLSFLLNKYGDKMQRETLENILSLLERIAHHPDVKHNFVCSGVTVVLKKILERDELASLFDRIVQISNIIEPKMESAVDTNQC